MDPKTYEDLVKEEILHKLHKICGVCSVCGKVGCRHKANTNLPDTLKTEDVLSAIDN